MNIFQRKMGFLLSRPCMTSWARAECGNMAERDRAEMPCTTMENGQVFHWRTVRSFLASTFIFFQSVHTKLFNDWFIYSSNQCIFWACIICQIPCMVLERWWRIRKTCELVARVFLWWGTQVNNQAMPTHCDRCFGRRKCAMEAQGGCRNKCQAMWVQEGFLEEVTSKLRPEEMNSIGTGMRMERMVFLDEEKTWVQGVICN